MAISLDFSLFRDAYKLRVVTNPNPLKAGKYRFTEDGLHSEQIFGPLKTYKCNCGNLFGRSNAGERCQKCDVLCDSDQVRSKTFARIDLPKGIYVMLPILKNLVYSIFGTLPVKNLLKSGNYESNKKLPYFYSLAQNKLIKLRKASKKENIIDLPVYDITTLHRLYKSMLADENYKDLILNNMITEEISKYVFVNFVLVTPPNSRPLAKLNEQYQAHVITAAYIEILKSIKNSFLDKAYSSNSEGFGQTVYKYQSSVDKLYKELTDKPFQRKENIVRQSLSGKIIETSQRSVIVPDPTLRPGSIAMSEESVKKLFQSELLRYIDKKYDEAIANDDATMMNYCTTIHQQFSNDGNFEITDEVFGDFLNEVGHELRMLLERPPVLWRHNISGVNLGKVYSDPTIKVVGTNTLIAPFFNFDFDGDNLSVFALTSIQAKNDFKYSFVENAVEFEHHRGLLPSLEHESIYALYMLSLKGQMPEDILEEFRLDKIRDNKIYQEISSLDELPTIIKDINLNPTKLYMFNNVLYTYNTLLINKALKANSIIYNGEYLIDKKEANKLLKKMREKVTDTHFYTCLHNFNKFLLECSTIIQYCNPTFDLKDFAISSEEITDYKKTLIKEPYIGFHQNDILFKDYVGKEVHANPDNILSTVFNSGARIKSVQLLKAVGNNGIPTNIYGKAFRENIKNSLLDGLTEEEFFMGGDSARLALAQRQEAIPKGGELQRKFYYGTGFLNVSDTEDCKTTKGFSMKIRDKNHLNTLYGRYYVSGEEIDINDESLIGTIVNLRSPIRCQEGDYKVCHKCLGKKRPQSKALGSSIGAFLSESIIQSVLRTHHFSGAFITNINNELIELIKSLRFESPNIVYYENEEDIKNIKRIEAILQSENYYNSSSAIIFEEDKLNSCFNIIVNETPFNDDSVKQLNTIVGVIDKNRDIDHLINPTEMYEFLLDNIILPNGILSIFVELVMSILFFDEDNIMIRYSEKEIDHQVALKNIIDTLDPKLAIFHNFSNKAINQIYTKKRDSSLDHMFFSLIDCYQ